MTETFWHDPVLKKEVLELLHPRGGERSIDCTIGGGGHALELLSATDPDGTLLGIDLDAHALAAVRSKAGSRADRITLAEGHFRDLDTIAHQHGFDTADIIFFDLGLSSHLIDDASHGLSFRDDAPLDMRFGPQSGALSAYEIVNRYSEDEIAGMLLRFGDERRAKQIARAIIQKRRSQPIQTTQELAALVATIYGSLGGVKKKIHPATRTFQALRVAVNDEVGGLQVALSVAPDLLTAPGGRLGVISYHSGEDRITKRAFARLVRTRRWKLLTPRVVRPTQEEISANPRARSARLRVIQSTI